MRPPTCPNCAAPCDTRVDETYGRARRRYFWECVSCKATAPTVADIIKRALLREEIMEGERADQLARNLEQALWAHYDLSLEDAETAPESPRPETRN